MEPERTDKKDDFETPGGMAWPMLTPADARLVNLLALAIGLVTQPPHTDAAAAAGEAAQECGVFQTLSYALVARLERRGLTVEGAPVPVHPAPAGVTQ